MGLILDSSVVIAAERRGDTVERLIEKIVTKTGDQEAALSAIGLTELVHGIYRAQTQETRLRRETFIKELLADVTVYPYTKETALLAGQLDGEQQSRGVVIPFVDLLIGATALSLGYNLLTDNLRHFGQIPGLSVISFRAHLHRRIPTCINTAFSTAVMSARDKLPSLLLNLCFEAVMIWSAIALRGSPLTVTSASPG
ncbi:MAG: PIN domain-containing protein [Candidatus Sulfotelmatobacter sp.]